MKIKSIIIAALALLMATRCDGQNKQEVKPTNNKAMSKSIVIFFSHAGDNYAVGNIEVGNTKIVADYISEIAGADQFEIVTHKYDGMAYTPLINSAIVKPQIMQIECHPYAQRKHWQQRLAEEGIQIECWFPLGGRDSKGEILRDKTINEIAQAHGKSAAQVIIRWHLQEGFSVIPGASNPAYIKENIEVFDFALSNVEMAKIRALNKEKRYFNMSYEDQVRWFSQWNPTD